MPTPIDQSRRDFLKRTATVAGAGSLAAGLPRIARAQTPSANERVGVGIIGLGGMGSTHLGVLMTLKEKIRQPVDIVAVCDVLSLRLEPAAAKCKAKAYKVWTDLIADKAVDVVLIATPDHWHAPMALAAAEAGKDLYCEKPMSHYDHLDLAKKVVETVARNKRVMQLGTQKLSNKCWGPAKEKVASLGTILHVECTDCHNRPVFEPLPKDIGVIPGKTLDWDMWLGCKTTRVPECSFDLRRWACFRDFWDYSGGPITDQLPHALTPWVKTLDLGFPKRVVTTGGLYFHKDGREVPDTVQMCIDYEGGPTVSLLGMLASDRNSPGIIRGQKATMVVREPNEVEIIPEGAAGGGASSVTTGEKNLMLYDHWRNLLSCVKTRNQPISDPVMGYRVMVALSMGVKSYRSGKAMVFDSQRGSVQSL